MKKLIRGEEVFEGTVVELPGRCALVCVIVLTYLGYAGPVPTAGPEVTADSVEARVEDTTGVAQPVNQLLEKWQSASLKAA